MTVCFSHEAERENDYRNEHPDELCVYNPQSLLYHTDMCKMFMIISNMTNPVF